MCALPTAPFDPAETLLNGLAILEFKFDPALTGVTATAATDVILKAGQTLVDGQLVQYVSGTGFTGLTAGTNYFVRDSNTGAGTFKVTATKGGAAVDITVDGTVGVFQPVFVVEAKNLDDDPESEAKPLTYPGRDGVLRLRRSPDIKALEKWMFDLLEFLRIREISGGAFRFSKTGTVTMWLPDVDNPDTAIALKSEEDFAVKVSRDGKISHGNGEFSKTTIKVESLEDHDIAWDRDVDES